MRTKLLLAMLSGGTLCGVLTLMQVTAADDPIHSLSEPQQKLFIDALNNESPACAAQCKPCKDQCPSSQTHCVPTKKARFDFSGSEYDCFPQLPKQAGAPLMIDLPELMGPIDRSMVETMKRKLGLYPLAGTLFDEGPCFIAMPPVPLFDGEAVHFPDKQVTAVIDDNDCPGSCKPINTTPSLQMLVPALPMIESVEVLRQSSKELETTADRLEQCDLYEQADAVRCTAQGLRQRARELRGASQQMNTKYMPYPSPQPHSAHPRVGPVPSAFYPTAYVSSASHSGQPDVLIANCGDNADASVSADCKSKSCRMSVCDSKSCDSCECESKCGELHCRCPKACDSNSCMGAELFEFFKAISAECQVPTKKHFPQTGAEFDLKKLVEPQSNSNPFNLPVEEEVIFGLTTGNTK